jgi:hypothetical protein
MAAIASPRNTLFRSACGVPSSSGTSESTMIVTAFFLPDFGFGGGFAGDEGRKDMELGEG